ncbi:MAG: ATPase domain-containing protein, partial [Smithellaceae bacterium]|nr:ATPase domain-containing protein [Smithellaceae bacterium]
LKAVGTTVEIKSLLTRLFDFLKMKQITTLLTDLTHPGSLERSTDEISSLIDTWFLLRDMEINGERNRGLYILKSRGMSHSNQIREFLISSRGVNLVDVYTGPSGVLTGSARAAQEAQEKASEIALSHEIARRRRELIRKGKVLDAKIEALRAEYASDAEELELMKKEENGRQKAAADSRAEMAALRRADAPATRKRTVKRKGKG